MTKSVKQRLITGGASALTGRICTVMVHLINSALLARLLSLEEMGSWFLAMSVIGFSIIIAPLGVNRSVVRFVAESMGVGKPGRAKSAIGKVFAVGIVGSLGLAAIYVFGIGDLLFTKVFHSPHIASVTILIALLIIAKTFQTIVADSLRGFHEILLAVIFAGLLTSLLVAVSYAYLLIANKNGSFSIVLWIQLGAVCLSVSFGTAALFRRLAPLKEDQSLPVSELLKVSLPMWFTSLMIFVLTQTDLWIIGSVLPPEDLAVYGVARRIVLLVVMPLGVVQSFVPPIIAEFYAKREIKTLERSLRLTATVACLPALGAFLLFILFGGEVLSLVYGEFYRRGSTVLLLLCLGQLVNVWAGTCGITLNMVGFERIMLWISLASGLATVIGACLAVHPFGIVGVASVYAGGMILQNILMLGFTRFKCGIWTCANLNPFELSRIAKLQWLQFMNSRTGTN